MKTKKEAAAVNSDQSSNYEKNYWNNCITDLKESQNFFKQKQLESYLSLAKSLAKLTMVELEKTMTEYKWLNDEDKHFIWKAISNEITAMVFKKRLSIGGLNNELIRN